MVAQGRGAVNTRSPELIPSSARILINDKHTNRDTKHQNIKTDHYINRSLPSDDTKTPAPEHQVPWIRKHSHLHHVPILPTPRLSVRLPSAPPRDDFTKHLGIYLCPSYRDTLPTNSGGLVIYRNAKPPSWGSPTIRAMAQATRGFRGSGLLFTGFFLVINFKMVISISPAGHISRMINTGSDPDFLYRRPSKSVPQPRLYFLLQDLVHKAEGALKCATFCGIHNHYFAFLCP